MRKFWPVAGVLVVLAVAVLGYRAYLIHEMRKPILAMMGDPDSAKFRSERYFGDWTGRNGILCGEVNAKNRMGGYVGYQWFKSTSERGQVEPDYEKVQNDTAGRDRCDFGGLEIAKWWWLRF